VDLRVPVIHRQHHSHDSHVCEVGIGNVIAEERTKLLQNKALHTQVPMAGTLIISSHDTRLRGGSDAAKRELHAPPASGSVTRPVKDETLDAASGGVRGTVLSNRLHGPPPGCESAAARKLTRAAVLVKARRTLRVSDLPA
jgi:hypothetical protein